MTFHVYQDAAGGWRWRLVAANGHIVADSGESYTRHEDAVRAARMVADAAAAAPDPGLTGNGHADGD